MYKATSKNGVITQNKNIPADGYSEIVIKNIGDSAVTIDDNIPLAPGESFNWNVDAPNVIDQIIFVRFVGAEANKKVLWVKTFYK